MYNLYTTKCFDHLQIENLSKTLMIHYADWTWVFIRIVITSIDFSARKTVNYGHLFFHWDVRRRYRGISQLYLFFFSRMLEKTVSLVANIDDRQLVALIPSNRTFLLYDARFVMISSVIVIMRRTNSENKWRQRFFSNLKSYNSFISVCLF